jgi:hypothetical protein
MDNRAPITNRGAYVRVYDHRTGNLQMQSGGTVERAALRKGEMIALGRRSATRGSGVEVLP